MGGVADPARRGTWLDIAGLVVSPRRRRRLVVPCQKGGASAIGCAPCSTAPGRPFSSCSPPPSATMAHEPSCAVGGAVRLPPAAARRPRRQRLLEMAVHRSITCVCDVCANIAFNRKRQPLVDVPFLPTGPHLRLARCLRPVMAVHRRHYDPDTAYVADHRAALQGAALMLVARRCGALELRLPLVRASPTPRHSMSAHNFRRSPEVGRAVHHPESWARPAILVRSGVERDNSAIREGRNTRRSCLRVACLLGHAARIASKCRGAYAPIDFLRTDLSLGTTLLPERHRLPRCRSKGRAELSSSTHPWPVSHGQTLRGGIGRECLAPSEHVWPSPRPAAQTSVGNAASA